MTTTKTKTNRIWILLSLVILFQPNLHIIDILPDFIAFFLLAKVLEHPSDVSPYFEEARIALRRMGWVNLLKIPALVLAVQIGGGIMTDTMALFALCFGVGDILLGVTVVRHLFDAIFYLGQRSHAEELLSSIPLGKGRTLTAEAYRSFTLFFVIAKYTIAMLPEFLLLTQGKSIDAEAFSGISYYPIAVLLTQAIGLAIGIVWLCRSIRYVKHTVSSGAFASALLESTDGQRGALASSRYVIRTIGSAMTILSVSTVLTLLIRTDNVGGAPLLPSFLFPLVFLFGILLMRRTWRGSMALWITGLIATGISVLNTVMTRAFFDEHTLGQMLVNEAVRTEYLPVRAASIAEGVAIAVWLVLFCILLRSFVREHTGISPTCERYRDTDRAYHAALLRKGTMFSILGMLVCAVRVLDAIFYGMPKSVLTHDPNEFANPSIVSPAVEWFGVVCVGASMLFIFYGFYFFSVLKDEVKMKYEMEG